MTARFVDTNVAAVLPSTDVAEERETSIARELLNDRDRVLSMQVLRDIS